MAKVKRVLSFITALAAMNSVFLTNSLNAFAYEVQITDIPSNVISGQVTCFDEGWNTISTSAKVSVRSGSAVVSGLSDTGYYTVTFRTDTKETGRAEFFLADSGKIYAYTYELKEDEYVPVYTNVSSVTYEDYGYGRILDISGNMSVSVEDIPSEAVTANVSVSLENGDYGEEKNAVTVKNGAATFGFGITGNYWITFLDKNDDALGVAEFTLKDGGKVYVQDYVYDSSSGEWEEKETITDVVYFVSYDNSSDFGIAADESESYSVTVSKVPATVSRVEIQYLDDSMNPADNYAQAVIGSNGTVTVNDLCTGFYTLNYYDSDYHCIGYTTFYLDKEGNAYSYDKSTKRSTLEYAALEQEKTYTFGKQSVSIYDVPEEVDSVEAYYYYGDNVDETLLFEPQYSSLYTNPLIVSGLGMEGKYKLNFYIHGVIAGNAEFYLDSSGNVYEYDYQYNSSTGEWEETLTKASGIYYYVNTDIEDADDYNYGDIKLSITDVPANVKYAEVTYFENDSTFTAGTKIFPSTTINGKGTADISNLGEEGYYEIELLLKDAQTRVGYVFVYIDSQKDVYALEQSINTDTFQVETRLTKTVRIPLVEYLSSTVEYEHGSRSVSVCDVPAVINRMLLTCVAPNGEYASYETAVTVTSAGTVVLDDLGMEGDYTLSFFADKDYVGTASFYLGADGTLYRASYSDGADGNMSVSLTNLDKVVFEEVESAAVYALGDLDFNGTISVTDVIALQKYLLAIQPFSASQYNNADINADGRVNVFDLTLLKKKLLNQ